MIKLWNIFLKSLGYSGLVLILVLSFGYYFLFVKKEKYHLVKDPLVQKKLEQWQDLKFGLFMHWGPYSQWGVVESWSICAEDEPWYARNSGDYNDYKTQYEALKDTFNPVDFNPVKWASAAKYAGMKYMVFTTKHHDGFCMFDTQTTDYKITDDDCPFSTDPRADVTRQIFDSFRKEDFMIGAYFSKPDWHSEYFWWPYFSTPDRNVNYKISKYPDRWESYVKFTHEQVRGLMTGYGRIDILWLDGGWVRPLTKFESRVSDFFSGLYLQAGYTQLRPPQSQDLKMGEMAALARKTQPGLIMVDRFVPGPEENYLTPENHVPEKYMEEPWESCIMMHDGWSYSHNAQYKSSGEIIHILVDVVSKGGNLLLNIGPGPEGTWHEEAYQILKEVGEWIKINGNAIYGTHGKPLFSEDNIRFTYVEDGSVNAIYMAAESERLPEQVEIAAVKPAKGAVVKMLGHEPSLNWEYTDRGIRIQIANNLRAAPPCDHAWTFNISDIK